MKKTSFPADGTDLRGMIYVRIRKASSTTLASINMRIAHNNVANFTGKVPIKRLKQNQDKRLEYRCATTYDHHAAYTLDISNRIKTSTFLWTFVRGKFPYIE